MLKISVFVIAALCLTANAGSQEFPKPLKPGERFVATAADTLFWVLKSSQYDKAIQNGLELRKANEMIETLEQQNQAFRNIIVKKDSTITDLTAGYERYKTMWEETDKKLEDAEVRILKQRRRSFVIGILGLAVGGVFGALVL
jgi:hypothetical protein